MTAKPRLCGRCPITDHTTGFVPPAYGHGTQLFLGEAPGEQEASEGKPFVGGAGQWLNSLLKAAKINRDAVTIANTICCRPPDNIFPGSQKWTATSKSDAKDAIEYCKSCFLEPLLTSRNWSRIVCLGNEAMKAVTGQSGILNWRGSPLPQGDKIKIIPTLHPAYLMRNSELFSVAVADLRKQPLIPPEHYTLFARLADLEAFDHRKFAFDFEWDREGNITIVGLCGKPYETIVCEFSDQTIPILKHIFENAEALIGHNIIGADMRHFEKLGWKVKAEILDTMLMQHLVQPDMPHSLAFTASVFTNKPFWKGKDAEAEETEEGMLVGGAQWKTWNLPDARHRTLGGYGGCNSDEEAFRLYNARDTDASYLCHIPLLNTLKKYEMWHTYRNVSVPTAFICRHMSEMGLKLDRTRLASIREDLDASIGKIEQTLPEGLAPFTEPCFKQIEAAPGTYRVKRKTCTGTRKEKHPEAELLFEQPDQQLPCPVCGRIVDAGKMVEAKVQRIEAKRRIVPWNSTEQVQRYAIERLGLKPVTNAKTGRATADKNARKVWGRTEAIFATVDELKKLSTLRNGFAKDGLSTEDRMYFNLLVHGTAEGRLSSSGRRRGIDINIQNAPKQIRKVFIPDDPTHSILNVDIVQGENMLTAWLAKDTERWERLHQPGFDEHSHMASLFFNQTVTKTNAVSHLRKIGKVINHGRNYGLGVRKTMDYLAAEGYFYSEKQIREMIETWKKVNRRTAEWQNETIALAKQQGYLQNAFGRKRWLQGPDSATKALAFLPASTLADMVLRMMIAMHADQFKPEIEALNLQAIGTFPEGWLLRIQVHDSLVAMGPDSRWQETSDFMAAIMTQSWPCLDNFRFEVETEYAAPGSAWGDCKKI